MKIEGLIAAPFTPFKEDLSINFDVIEALAKFYHSQPLAGIFINGTTGEGMSLTIEERIELADHWIRYSSNDFKIIVHVGHTSLNDCIKMAIHAQKIGAYAIGAMGPCFFKPKTVNDLTTFCSEIAQSAPQIPFYFYHMPSMTGNTFKMIDFLKNAADIIPNLAGIKYTWENLMEFRDCINLDNNRFDMLFGRDEILLAGLAMGAKGAVGSTYNYASPLYSKIIAAYSKRELAEAQKYQDLSIEIVKALLSTNASEIAVNKFIMKYYSKIDCGPVRQPLTNMTKDEIISVTGKLKNIIF